MLTDHTGAVVGAFTYDPYGSTTATTGTATTSNGYAGAYKDSESGFLYLINRYYNPGTAQFLTRDPLESLTQSAYGYVGDNPINGTDPSGLFCLGHICTRFDPMAALRAVVNIGRGASFGLSDKIANWLQPGASCTVAQSSIDQLIGGTATVVVGGAYLSGLGPAAEAGNPLEGTTYTQKVLDQMDQDIYHGFPSLIDTLPSAADASPVSGADGVTRTLVKVSGAINGAPGDYEWMVDPDGSINHRFFNKW